MAKIGVLSTRTRVEEKQLLAALVETGVSALPVSPAALPAPLGPSPFEPLAGASASGVAATLMIDRLQDRALAAAALRLVQAQGCTLLGAGIAAMENRLVVATTLMRAGIARPATHLVFDEASALTAIDTVGYPATFFPLEPKLDGIVIADRDTAEAVMEHRDVLGARHDALGLVQAGIATNPVMCIVVNGRVAGVAGTNGSVSNAQIHLAEASAAALQAGVVGVSIVETVSGPVVWDIDPVPDFRDATATGTRGIAEAIVDLAIVHSGAGKLTDVLITTEGVRHDTVVSIC